jgi:uncharacterized protein involved in exopolysaccharide biosynthesis
MAVDIAGSETALKNLQDQGLDTRGAQANLAVLQNKLATLEKMLEEAKARKRDRDLAEVQYVLRARIRNERKETLNSIQSLLDKLRIIHDDPQTVDVQLAGYAPEPERIIGPRWRYFLLIGMLAGALLGVAHVGLSQ